MWNRWKAGQSFNAIGRALGKDKQVIHFVLARHGGIAPRARRRSKLALTLAEREDISRGIASGCSMRVIAQGLRHRSLDGEPGGQPAMAGARSIEPVKPTPRPGSRPCAQAVPAGHPP